MQSYDLIIIGGGIIGCATARELSRYQLKTAVLEANSDVGAGTTKANGGIVHAGDDPAPGTLKAKLNVQGCMMYEEYSKELGFRYKKTGSMIIGFNEEDLKALEVLLDNGIKNGVPGIELITDPARILELEPQCHPDAKYAVYTPHAGIVDPFEVAIACCENAVENGVDFYLDSPVTAIEKQDGKFILTTPNGQFSATYIVNAAGIHADDIAALAGIHEYKIICRHGDILIMDKECGVKNLMTLYPIPTAEKGKGVVAFSTVSGNVIVGSSAIYREKDDINSYKQGIDELIAGANKLVNGLNTRKVIRTFAGQRAVVENYNNDFYIKPSETCKNFFHVAGIQSPGVASAPAIAQYVVNMLRESGVSLAEKADFQPHREEPADFSEMSREDQNALIQSDSRFGKIVCRCETVTEGEIVAAIHRNPPARTVEAVKRRTRAGMGRCQSGFCQSKVVLILARELGITPEEVRLESKNSWILSDCVKEGK